MSVQIKSLTDPAPTVDIALQAVADNFNLIPKANTVYTLYTAPTNKAAIVKSIRMVNILAQTVEISLYLNKSDSNGFGRRRRLVPLTPIPQKGAIIDDSEITLEPGDRIQASADVGNAIHYVISGVEREVV